MERKRKKEKYLPSARRPVPADVNLLRVVASTLAIVLPSHPFKGEVLGPRKTMG